MFSGTITKDQARGLADYFRTKLIMNDALDLVRSTGPTGGRIEALDAAKIVNDEALRGLVASFEDGK